MQTTTNLPEPIAAELWTKIDQSHSIVSLAQRVARNDEVDGETSAQIASALEVAQSLLNDVRRLVDKCR
jgi:hypothetical protein